MKKERGEGREGEGESLRPFISVWRFFQDFKILPHCFSSFLDLLRAVSLPTPSLSPTLFISISLTSSLSLLHLSLPIYLSLYLSLSPWNSIFFSRSHYLSLSPYPLYPSLSLNFSHSISLSLPIYWSLPLPPSVFPCLSFSYYLPPSFFPSLTLFFLSFSFISFSFQTVGTHSRNPVQGILIIIVFTKVRWYPLIYRTQEFTDEQIECKM